MPNISMLMDEIIAARRRVLVAVEGLMPEQEQPRQGPDE